MRDDHVTGAHYVDDVLRVSLLGKSHLFHFLRYRSRLWTL
jgi:hypothetical protein